MTVDGARDAARVCPTSLGQLGVALPPGEHGVRLVYRDPWVPVGGAVTLVTLLAAALVSVRATRQSLPAARP